MPRLRQVLPESFFDIVTENLDVACLLDVEVEAIKFNNGSPCDGHTAMFATWPGEGNYVRQWFLLVNGKAVAVDEVPNLPWRFPVIDYEREV